jgi:hypothetical protein
MSTKNVKSGQQGTDRPWERPDQSSQDPSIDPPRRNQREGHYEAPPSGPLNSPPRTAPPAGIRHVDRLTEDDMAQAALGGPKGSPELPPAPLTKTEREQNSPNDDPGHVA